MAIKHSPAYTDVGSSWVNLSHIAFGALNFRPLFNTAWRSVRFGTVKPH
jgi:hypothetical protein